MTEDAIYAKLMDIQKEQGRQAGVLEAIDNRLEKGDKRMDNFDRQMGSMSRDIRHMSRVVNPGQTTQGLPVASAQEQAELLRDAIRWRRVSDAAAAIKFCISFLVFHWRSVAVALVSGGVGMGVYELLKRLIQAAVSAAPVLCLVLCVAVYADDPPGRYIPGFAVVEMHGYTVCYDYVRKEPRWVSYELINGSPGSVERDTYSFHTEDGTDTPEAVHARGDDIGHLHAAEDADASPEEMADSFSMLNAFSQSRKVNRGDWREGEDALRRASIGTRIRVVCGPIHTSATSPRPEAAFKVALYADGRRYAWLYPNDQDAPNRTPDAYLVPLSTIERLTGLSFP
jgi:hypothetical protein